MAPGERSLNEGAERLITLLTGIEAPSENFDIAKNFVVSNFKYHRFLDADSHKITRAYEGLIEKFEIHAQYDKAEALARLIERLRELRVVRLSGAAEKLSVHYPVLSFLSLLANSPTEAPYEPSPKYRPPTSDEAAFDWTEELRQDVSAWAQECDDDSDAESTDGHTGEYGGSDSDTDTDARKEEDAAREADEPAVPTQAASGGRDSTSMAIDDALALGAALLDSANRAVVRRYWEQDEKLAVQPESLCARLAAHRQSLVRVPHAVWPTTALRERELVAEVLWMLGGSPTHAFGAAGTDVAPPKGESVVDVSAGPMPAMLRGLCLAEVSEGAVAAICSEFVALGRTMRELGEFCALASRGWYGLCHQSFAASLFESLEHVRAELSRLERPARHGGLSLLGLRSALAAHSRHVHLLSRVVAECVLPHESPADVAVRASHLLTSLVNMLCEEDLENYARDVPPRGDNSDACDDGGLDARRVVLRLLCDAARPYLTMLNEWMGSGTVTADPQSEFAIVCDPAIPATAPAYWSNAVSVRGVPHPYPRLNAEEALTSGVSLATLSLGLGVPAFLLPRLHEIVLAGKSMRLLRHMDERNSAGSQRVRRAHEAIGARESLGDAFVRLLSLPLGAHTSGQASPPIGVQLSSFLDAVEGLYESTCRLLLRRLETECALSAHFGALADVFLMAAGGAMFEFAAAIFEKVEAGENWRDPTFLAASLQLALSLRGGVFGRGSLLSLSSSAHELSVAKDRLAREYEDEGSPLDPYEMFEVSAEGEGGKLVEMLDVIRLHFHVAWPLEFVIDRASIDEYNRAFRFVLRMKRAKWTLERLRWPRGAPTIYAPSGKRRVDDYGALQHPMRLLRAKLLHFTNTLHVHILTRVLHSEGAEFRKAVAAARDLDGVIAAHRAYVATVVDRCLLSDKVAMIRDAITKMLSLALSFGALWKACAVSDEAPHATSTLAARRPSPAEALAEVSRIDGEYTRFVRFVISLIGGVTKRGAHPHLEALVIALGTTNAV